MKTAVTFDHVAAVYQKNMRKNTNFIKLNCVMFDIDNTDSDRAAEWISYDKLHADFPDVEYYIVTSRNHMKEKGKQAPQPELERQSETYRKYTTFASNRY